MNLINEVLRDYLHQGVYCYLDDILIYSNTLAEHAGLGQKVFNRLKQKLSVC